MSDTAAGPPQQADSTTGQAGAEEDQPASSETPAAAAAPVDELEPQLKYERLGADVKSILQDATATCLCLSEKVLALGTSAGNIHILDYSGNEVKRFPLHSKPVKQISFDDKAEYFASCCGDAYISVTSLYTDETNKFTFKRPITVVALEPRYASRKTHEFVTGDVRGRLKLSSQGWLGRSDHVLHQGEGTIRAVSWLGSTLAWANEVGIKVYDTNMHQFVGSLRRPRGGRYADCFDCQLYLHQGDGRSSGSSSSSRGGGGSGSTNANAQVLYVAWPDCIKVADVLTHVDATSGAVSKALRVSASIPTDYFCMGVVPHGPDLAVLVFVTDADPDQEQVDMPAAAPAADGSSQQQQQQPGQLTMQALPQQQQQPAGGGGGDGSSSSPAQQQADAEVPADSAAAAAAAEPGPSLSGPSQSGPISIPQPVRRGPRAANAYVRSPGGPSFLSATSAAAAATAGDTAAGTAATAAGSSTGTSPAGSTPRPAEGILAGGSGSSSPDVDRARVLSSSSAAAGTAAAGAAAVQRSPSGKGGSSRPPLPSGYYSRSSSTASRGSAGGAAAVEGLAAPYTPPGHPLRPELRILSLAQHTHGTPAAAAAGTSKLQQQQQVCTPCSEVASDALSVKGYEHYLPANYHFVPSYGNEFALLSGVGAPPPSQPRRRDREGPSSSSSRGQGGSSGGAGSGVSSVSSSRRVSGAAGGAAAAAAAAALGVGDAGGSGGSKLGSAAAAGAQQQQQQQEEEEAAAEDASAAAAADGSAAEAAADAAGAAAAVDGAEAAAGEPGDTAADAAAAGDAAGDDTAAAAAEPSLAEAEAAAAAAAAALAADADAAAAASDVLEDFREFMYFIVAPQDIVIGRHRDMVDRITWCLAVGRYEAALSLAEADRTTSSELWDTVVQAYLSSLTSAGRWGDAASMLPRLLKDSAAAWERWLYTFAQARQLSLLAPVLPVKDPLLPSQAYDLVLQSLLVDPSHHLELLDLVSSWPHAIFHPNKLIDTIAQRMQRPGGESRELWQVLALLYKGQGRPDLSLAIYLQLQLPSVFDFIQEHGLLLCLDRNAYLLMAIDERRALELLAAHLDTLPPGAVVPGLLDATSVCESKGDEGERELWRRRLFDYLDKAFGVDPSSVADYAELAVHLYADYCPARLMDFLQGSQTYPLEAALEVAQQRGLVDEQVYVLSRMGNSGAALRLIIRNQQDIPRAIEFVRLQRDEELWEELIDWALSSADTTGQLLDHIGGNINPLRVIQKIPEGLAIEHLRDRLRAIISDFRTQTSLREGCNAILRSDCLHLVTRLQREVQRALPTVWLQRLHTHAATAAAAAAAADGSDAASNAAGADQDEAPAAAAATAAGAAKSTNKGAAAAQATAAAAAAASGHPYLPASLSSKGPQWLRYQCGSGRAMQVASTQEVPAVAVHALAAVSAAAAITPVGGAAAAAAALGSRSTAGIKSAAFSSSGTYGPLSGVRNISSSSIGLALTPPQPHKVWIGRPTLVADSEGFGPCGLGPEGVVHAGEAEQDGLAAGAGAVSGGGAAAAAGGGSRRASQQQTMRQRGASGAVSLPSLVAA